MTSLSRTTLSVALAAGLAVLLLPARPAHALRGCELMDCGSNTPVIYGTPIQGLSLRGERSFLASAATPRGSEVWVKLDPTLSRAQPAPWRWWAFWRGRAECLWVRRGALRLGVRNGELVAKDERGQIACRGKEMIGMVFTIHVPITTCKEISRPNPSQPDTCGKSVTVCESTSNSHAIQLRIDQRGEVRDWIAAGAIEDEAHLVPTYRLVLHSVPSAATDPEIARLPLVAGTSLCPMREKWMSDWQELPRDLDVKTHATGQLNPTERRWRAATDHLLIVQGETYKRDATVFNQGENWFNLACAGTALSKLRLLGYDPMANSGQAPERQATLKMLTGRYRGEQSFTSPGMPLWWGHSGGGAFLGTPDPARLSPNIVEAYWGPQGALCVSHRRTWRQAGAVASSVDEYTRGLTPEADEPAYLPPGCALSTAPAECAARMAEAEERSLHDLRLPSCNTPPTEPYFWVTRPVDHIPH